VEELEGCYNTVSAYAIVERKMTNSPVIRTRDSIPAHSSFKAVTGVRVKTSILLGDGGVSLPSWLVMGMARPLSAEGFGRGGRMKVNESAES